MTDTLALAPAQMAALLCARLCHDLVSPVSALGAALSVLDDENAADMRDDALDLVRTGVRQAQSKLEYARLAYGAGGSAPGVIDMREIQRLAGNLYKEAKQELIWKTEANGLGKPAARVLLNLLMLAVDSIPRGGQVTIDVTSNGGGTRIRLISQGKKARIEESVKSALAGKAPEDGFDGRSILPYYAGLIAREVDGRVDTHVEEERTEFSALIPPMEGMIG